MGPDSDQLHSSNSSPGENSGDDSVFLDPAFLPADVEEPSAEGSLARVHVSPTFQHAHFVRTKSGSSSKHQKLSSTLSDGAAVCRICHGSENSCLSGKASWEPLISPCDCRGTMGLYHRSCLEKWLSTSQTEKCEICKFPYPTERLPKSFCSWLKNPGSYAERRNLIGDSLCLLLLTPLAVCSTWLCVQGALHYAAVRKEAVEVPGLLCLAVFLVLTYTVWLLVSLRYHYCEWKDWRRKNMLIRVLDAEQGKNGAGAGKDGPLPRVDDNNNHLSPPPLPAPQQEEPTGAASVAADC